MKRRFLPTIFVLLASCVQEVPLIGERYNNDRFQESPAVFRFQSFTHEANEIEALIILTNEGEVPVCISRYPEDPVSYSTDFRFNIRRPIDGAYMNFPWMESTELALGTPHRNSRSELEIFPGESLEFRFSATWGDVTPLADVEFISEGPPNGRPVKAFERSDQLVLTIETGVNDCTNTEIAIPINFYRPEVGVSPQFGLQ